jgi:hypothetical protein
MAGGPPEPRVPPAHGQDQDHHDDYYDQQHPPIPIASVHVRRFHHGEFHDSDESSSHDGHDHECDDYGSHESFSDDGHDLQSEDHDDDDEGHGGEAALHDALHDDHHHAGLQLENEQQPFLQLMRRLQAGNFVYLCRSTNTRRPREFTPTCSIHIGRTRKNDILIPDNDGDLRVQWLVRLISPDGIHHVPSQV